MSAFKSVTRRRTEARDELGALQDNICMLFSQENWLISEVCQKLMALKDSIAHINGTIARLQPHTEPQSEPDRQTSTGRGDFQYSLEAKEPLQQPLYKDRKFQLGMVLRDRTGQVSRELDSTMIELALYTNESPRKRIEVNHEGGLIFKGDVQEQLSGGQCLFERVQVREVSSHFRTGRVFLCAQVKCEQLRSAVRPFEAEVTVKAKKQKDAE